MEDLTFLECDTAPEVAENFNRVKAAMAAIMAAMARVTVEFNSDGGSVVADQIIVTGTTALCPVAPTKEESVFAGWFIGEDEEATEFDFSTPIEADITLTAHWTDA